MLVRYEVWRSMTDNSVALQNPPHDQATAVGFGVYKANFPAFYMVHDARFHDTHMSTWNNPRLPSTYCQNLYYVDIGYMKSR